MPTEMKKTLAKRSRKGATSAMAWWLYSVSETSNPATNAPRASENPSACVAQASARQMPSEASTNVSRMRVRATRSKSGGAILRAATTMPAMAAIEPPKRSARSEVETPTSPARIGTRTIIGTMRKSWKSRMPSTWRPCGVSISRRSP